VVHAAHLRRPKGNRHAAFSCQMGGHGNGHGKWVSHLDRSGQELGSGLGQEPHRTTTPEEGVCRMGKRGALGCVGVPPNRDSAVAAATASYRAIHGFGEGGLPT